MPRGNSTMSGRAARSAQPGRSQHASGMSEAQQSEGMLSRCLRESNEMIERNPATCMAITLGTGFALGLVIGMLSGGRRHVDERSAVERFSRRVLDAVHNALPESLARHMP